MNRRLAFIDTLRGIAVLAVVLQHTLELVVSRNAAGDYYSAFQNLIGYYFNFGRFGVVLFFFVSGFVIPYSFPNTATPIRDFTISRFFRLYPAYWLSIVVGLIVMSIMSAASYPLWQIAVNLTMFQTFVNVPHLWVFYWTLAIELIFYIGCAGLFALGLLNRPRTALYIVIAASLLCIIGPLLIDNRTVWRLMEVALNLTAMFLGKMVRDTVIGGKLRWWHVAIGAGLYCVFAITISFKLYGGEYRDNFFYGYSIGLAYIGAAIMFIVFASFGERMSSRFMAFVGMISYSIYLMSPFVIVWISHIFGVGMNPLGWSLFVLGSMALSILFSWLTYSAVEKPVISFGHRFRSRSRPIIALDTPLSSQGAE